MNASFDRTESYLFGQLNAAERAAFEAEMAQKPELLEAVELQKLEHRAMELAVQAKLRARFSDWKSEESAEKTAKTGGKILTLTWFRLAAAASVLLVAGFFVQDRFFGSPSKQELAMTFFEGSASSVRGGGEVPAILIDAMDAMKRNNWAEAAKMLENIQDESQKTNAMLLLGECYFHLKLFEKAQTTFERAKDIAESVAKKERAEWLWALTMLANGDEKMQGEQALKQISGNKRHSYHQKAVELMKALK